MPAIIAALWTGFLAVLGGAVGQIVAALGMGVVTYSGVSASLTFFKTMALTHLTSLPPSVIGMLGVMKIGVCISMVLSAITMRLTLNGMKSDTVRHWRINK